MSQDPKPTRGDSTTWASLCHVAALIGSCFALNWLVPLAVMFLFRDEPFVVSQAKEVLNFQISMILYALIAVVLCFTLVGIPIAIMIAFGLVIFGIIFPIVGAVSAAGGNDYRYPLTIRLVK